MRNQRDFYLGHETCAWNKSLFLFFGNDYGLENVWRRKHERNESGVWKRKRKPIRRAVESSWKSKKQNRKAGKVSGGRSPGTGDPKRAGEGSCLSDPGAGTGCADYLWGSQGSAGNRTSFQAAAGTENPEGKHHHPGFSNRVQRGKQWGCGKWEHYDHFWL